MEKYFSKFINLAGIYPEVGVVLHDQVLSTEKAREWRMTLDQNLEPEGLMLAKYKNFTIDFIITSSTSLTKMVVRGPRKSSKKKFLEYAIWIPYNPVVGSNNPLAKLTEYFKQGVTEVLRQLEYPEESIRKALEKITDKPTL